MACCLAALPGCAGNGAGPLAPSPVIVPDAITIATGTSQIFRVENATVAGFSVTGEGFDWKTVAAVDSTYSEPNAVRLQALKTSPGNLYVTADLGPHRSPLVAVVAIGR